MEAVKRRRFRAPAPPVSGGRKPVNPLVMIEQEWGNCVRCPLGNRATQHCLWDIWRNGHRIRNIRAAPPIDVMLVGEGPGEVENMNGYPFTGPAGKFLHKHISLADPRDLTLMYTNLVVCRPQDVPGAIRNRTPNPDEVAACSPRLVDMIRWLTPFVIIALGDLPASYLHPMVTGANPPIYTGRLCLMKHPAWFLHKGRGDDIDDQYVAMFRSFFGWVRANRSVGQR